MFRKRLQEPGGQSRVFLLAVANVCKTLKATPFVFTRKCVFLCCATIVVVLFNVLPSLFYVNGELHRFFIDNPSLIELRGYGCGNLTRECVGFCFFNRTPAEPFDQTFNIRVSKQPIISKNPPKVVSSFWAPFFISQPFQRYIYFLAVAINTTR